MAHFNSNCSSPISRAESATLARPSASRRTGRRGLLPQGLGEFARANSLPLASLALLVLVGIAPVRAQETEGRPSLESSRDQLWGNEETTASAISELALRGQAALPVLRDALRDPAHRFSVAPLRVIQRMGPLAAPLVPDLVERLERDLAGEAPSFAVTWHSIEALKQIGPPASASREALEKILRRPNPTMELQLQALKALLSISPALSPELSTSLEFALRHTRNTISRTAAEGVRKFGDRRLAPAVAELLERRDHQTRSLAVEVLVRLGEPSVVHPLLKSSRPEVRLAALSVLARSPNREALPGVLVALDDPDSRVRAAAHHTLHCLAVALPPRDTSWLVPRFFAREAGSVTLALLVLFLVAWRLPRQRPTGTRRVFWVVATSGISCSVVGGTLYTAFSHQWVRLTLPQSDLLLVTPPGAILLTGLLCCALATALAYLRKPPAVTHLVD